MATQLNPPDGKILFCERRRTTTHEGGRTTLRTAEVVLTPRQRKSCQRKSWVAHTSAVASRPRLALRVRGVGSAQRPGRRFICQLCTTCDAGSARQGEVMSEGLESAVRRTPPATLLAKQPVPAPLQAVRLTIHEPGSTPGVWRCAVPRAAVDNHGLRDQVSFYVALAA